MSLKGENKHSKYETEQATFLEAEMSKQQNVDFGLCREQHLAAHISPHTVCKWLRLWLRMNPRWLLSAHNVHQLH